MTDTVIFAMFEQYDAKLASLGERVKLAEDRAQFWREKFDERIGSIQSEVTDICEGLRRADIPHTRGKFDDIDHPKKVNSMLMKHGVMTQPVAGTSGFVDPVFPIPEPTRVTSEIHTEEQKVAT